MVGGFAFMDRGLNFKKGILADKKIRLILCALILLWVAVLTQVLMQHFMKQNVQIAEAFMDTEVVTSKSSIEIAGEYITKSLTDEQKEDVICRIADQIGLNVSSEDLVYVDTGKATEVSVSRKSKSASTKIQLVSVNVNKDGEIPVINNYVMVRMEVYDHVESIMHYKKLLQKVFDQLEITGESSYVQFTGKYPGQLTLDSKNEITKQMIGSLGGHVTYENRADDLYTVYAYSGGLSDYISVGKSKVNIQVAMSYNELTDETMVYLATPIMNGSY